MLLGTVKTNQLLNVTLSTVELEGRMEDTPTDRMAAIR